MLPTAHDSGISVVSCVQEAWQISKPVRKCMQRYCAAIQSQESNCMQLLQLPPNTVASVSSIGFGPKGGRKTRCTWGTPLAPSSPKAETAQFQGKNECLQIPEINPQSFLCTLVILNHFNMFHFPGVERLQTRPPSVCRSPPASPGERQRLQHISLVFQELTQQERREDGVTRMMASSNQLANEFTKQPSNRPANPIQNPNPNPTKKYENIQNQPHLSAVQSMPTPLHNLQSPAFNSRFNDSIAVV